MTLPPPSEHFQGKTVPDHLKEARAKGAIASSEVHGIEMPGHISAAVDAAKETVVALLIIWIIIRQFSLSSSQILSVLIVFSCGWLIWKIGRSALLAWSRLERLHRLIEEERWEIEHHRDQEREELTELYRAKGLQGKLLEETIDVLMADDNRLLRIMLEEELGLTLETFEHPLKQSVGAGFGVLCSAALSILGFWINPLYGIFVTSGLLILISTYLGSKLEKNRPLSFVVWSLGLAGLSAAAAYFISQAFSR
ncbi:MAG TPA: VIT1/CCC1 transporter family protein [Rhabdochlamydiaceae bacterium]|nr:VIT1/CCC1 transporter family protein [Rhabdochlamydiaceae bacterium]